MAQGLAGEVPPFLYRPESHALYQGEDRHQYSAFTRQQPPMEIADMLNFYCHLSSELYFLAVRMYDGRVITFSTAGMLSPDDVRSFFNKEKFQQTPRQLRPKGESIPAASSQTVSNLDSYRIDNSQDPAIMQQHLPVDHGDGRDSIKTSAHKRRRTRNRKGGNGADGTTSGLVEGDLDASDAQAVYNFYEQCLHSCQQFACKLLAKAWIKVLAPKKQSTHPYTGSVETAPDWWPKSLGQEKSVRHKEPDHLYKRERVHLLIHILRLAAEPAKHQPPEFQRLSIDVEKLEAIAREALSGWLASSEANRKKKHLFDSIFRVARREESFKDSMLDGRPEVTITDEALDVQEVREVNHANPVVVPTRASATTHAMRNDHYSVNVTGGPGPRREAEFTIPQRQTQDPMIAHQLYRSDGNSHGLYYQPAPAFPEGVVLNASNHDNPRSSLPDINDELLTTTQWQPVPDAVNDSQSYASATEQARIHREAYSDVMTIPYSSTQSQEYYLRGSYGLHFG